MLWLESAAEASVGSQAQRPVWKWQASCLCHDLCPCCHFSVLLGREERGGSAEKEEGGWCWCGQTKKSRCRETQSGGVLEDVSREMFKKCFVERREVTEACQMNQWWQRAHTVLLNEWCTVVNLQFTVLQCCSTHCCSCYSNTESKSLINFALTKWYLKPVFVMFLVSFPLNSKSLHSDQQASSLWSWLHSQWKGFLVLNNTLIAPLSQETGMLYLFTALTS